MSEERRSFARSRCLIPAELLKAGGKNLIERATVHDFSPEGLKLIINFNLHLGSNIEIKLCLPEKNLKTSLSGEIVWVRYVNNKMEAGLKISEMNQKAKDEILDWVSPKWLEKEIDKKKK